jgi:uncharacterized protein YndB with AHSA1/START domain
MESLTASPFTLEINRILKAPPTSIWKCWTTPELLMQWFCPRPWKVVKADMDLRVGGQGDYIMQGPNGESVPNRGVYLAIEENRRLVFTDAFRAGWLPSEKPFMVGEINLSPTPENFTHYIARAHHWSAKDMEDHQKMGFEAGWNAAADQLEELARTV